jgi:hypothetical protein
MPHCAGTEEYISIMKWLREKRAHCHNRTFTADEVVRAERVVSYVLRPSSSTFASLRSGLSKPPVNIATSSGRQPRLIEAHAQQSLQTDGVIRSHDGAHRGRLYGPFLTNTMSDASIEVTHPISPEESRPLGRVLPALTLGISIVHTNGAVSCFYTVILSGTYRFGGPGL